MTKNYVVATDNGNSSIKMIMREGIENTLLKQASIVTSILTRSSDTEGNLATSVEALMDNLIVQTNSGAIRMNGMYAVGEKATKVKGTTRNLNIVVGDKKTNDIPLIVSFSMIAAKAIQDYFAEIDELPTNLKLDLKYSGALPAREYTTAAAKELESKLVDNKHLIQVFVADEIVNVELNIKAAKITQEGNPALYAFLNTDVDPLAEFNKRYGVKYTPKDLMTKKILVVDIGDGTSEFIFVNNGKPIADLSTGERLGVGHVSELALTLFKEIIALDIRMNRQQFQAATLDATHHYHSEACEALERAKSTQITAIMEKLSEHVLDTLQANVDIIMVIGGGAITFRETLETEVDDFTKKMRAKYLWVADDAAVTMNVEGLDVLNQKVFFK